jgi:hypothetical protein
VRTAGTAVAAVTAAVLAGVAGTGCDVQRAVDCAELALAVAASGDAVEDAAGTERLQDDVTAYEELNDDLADLGDRVEDTEVREAADAVSEAARNLERAAEDGTAPDLSPLADAIDELTEVCTPADEG